MAPCILNLKTKSKLSGELHAPPALPQELHMYP